MEHQEILILAFEGDGHLGNALRQIVESCPNPDFRVGYQTFRCLPLNDEELSQIIVRTQPLLILLALPRVPVSCLDSLFEVLGPSSARIVVVTDVNQEELIERVGPAIADFIIPPLRDTEVMVRIRRLLNQGRQEKRAARC